MSHFYAVIHGNRGESTRCGSKGSGITTTCASWSGAVRCMAWYDEQTGADWVRVSLMPWHGAGVNRTLFVGPIDEAQEARQGVA